MTDAGHRQVERIRGQLRCPGCEYDLRGLGGAIVICPECGTATDVARLVVAEWRGAWHKAPGYATLVWPVGWLLGGVLALLFAWAWHLAGSIGWTSLALIGVGTVLGWIWLLARMRNRMAGRAIMLSLLAHGLTLGYVCGLVGGFWSLKRGLESTTTASLEPVVWLVTLSLFVAMLWACRRCERWMAGACIRHHLLDQSRVETPRPAGLESAA